MDYELAYRRLSDPEQVCSAEELQDVLQEFEVALSDVERAPDAHRPRPGLKPPADKTHANRRPHGSLILCSS